MLLAIDVGNTNIVIGVFKGGDLIADWRISVSPYRTSDEYVVIVSNLFNLKGLRLSDIQYGIVSSVVPQLTNVIIKFIEQYCAFAPLIVGPGIKTGISIKYENPKEVGADRIVNAVAGIEKYGAPIIIVDFGTATTFDAISCKGEYLGGAIAPGIGISSEALFTKASRLSKIELIFPAFVIGKNTCESIQSGIMFGYTGLVDGIIERMLKELEGDVNVIATGGLSAEIISDSKYLKHTDPFLTLNGLRIIFQKNI